MRYLRLAERLEPDELTGILRTEAQSYQRLAELRPIQPARDLPVDINLTRALALHERLRRMDMPPAEALAAALARLRGLLADGQVDAALEALKTMEAIPTRSARDAREVSAVAVSVRARYAQSLRRWEALKRSLPWKDLAPAERALLLSRRDLGLIDEAIRELASANTLPRRARLQLGDLYLRRGLTRQARRTYRRVSQPDWTVELRLALCDWADGDFAPAARKLASAFSRKAWAQSSLSLLRPNSRHSLMTWVASGRPRRLRMRASASLAEK